MDSATSMHHDPISLQPNRAVVAILSAAGEPIPFAHYLPADIGSNQAILAIMNHRAGNTFGAYEQDGLMDGVSWTSSPVSLSILGCLAWLWGAGECAGSDMGKHSENAVRGVGGCG